MPSEKKQDAVQKQRGQILSPSVKVRPFSVRQTAWLFIRDSNKVEGEKCRYLDQLLEISEDLQRLYSLVQQLFRNG